MLKGGRQIQMMKLGLFIFSATMGEILSLAKNHRSDLLKRNHILLKPSKIGKL
jgi:hypothetical protein